VYAVEEKHAENSFLRRRIGNIKKKAMDTNVNTNTSKA
jgi:hypothetical protein